jgi:transposase InsO family protein
MYQELRARGYVINRKRVERLMRVMGLNARPPKRYVVTTDSDHDEPIAPNILAQDFTADRPNQKWVGDITYLDSDQGWLYLATVIDLYSRKIVGWALADSLQSTIVIDALKMAIDQRRPPPGIIFHSDRGCQYASEAFRTYAENNGIQRSMSKTGCCYDNAVAESFFHTFKIEEAHRRRYPDISTARSYIFHYLAYYNRTRRHSTNNYLSPDNHEAPYYAA